MKFGKLVSDMRLLSCNQPHEIAFVARFEVEGTFIELFELEHFPFDHQELTAKLRCQCAEEGGVAMEFSGLETAVAVIDVNNFALQNTWNIEKRLQVKLSKVSPMEGRTYPVLNFTAHVSRIPGFYVWNVALPMSMLSLAAFLQFEVDEQDVADRASISLTLLLTAVAYKLVTAGMVPAISYLTLLDKFVSACIMLMLLLLVESGITNELIVLEVLGWRPKNERGFIQLLFGVWVLVNVWFGAQSFMTQRGLVSQRRRRDEIHGLEEESRTANYRDRLKMSPSNKNVLPPGRPPFAKEQL